MKVLAIPDAYRSITDAGREARLERISEAAATIENPLQLGSVLSPLGSGYWKDRIGSDRIIAITERNPASDEWELIITDVFRRDTGEVAGGGYRRVLDDLGGTREQRRADVEARRRELIEVAPAVRQVEASPSQVLGSSDELSSWLDLKWRRPRASAVLLGRQAWDRGLEDAADSHETACSLLGRVLQVEAEPGDLGSATAGGYSVSFVEVPGELFHAKRAVLLLAVNRGDGVSELPEGLLEGVAQLRELCIGIHLREHDPFAIPHAFRGLADWMYPLDTGHPIERFGEDQMPVDASLMLELTLEQRELLDEALLQRPPLFLTGRAGSSKSTILHQAFARYCVAADRLALPGRPVFITRGDRLRREAVRRVRSILLLDYHVALSANDRDLGELVESRMVTFSEHLISALPASERSRFSPAHYVDYSRFRDLYLGQTLTGSMVAKELAFPDHQVRDSIEPSLAWFVLRALVKGFEASRDWSDDDECFGVEDYVALPERDRVVTDSEFATVVNRILPWYRRIHVEQGSWDDQDLALAVYRSPSATSDRVAAIVCDEAQDFTRVELLGLMRTTCFFDYDLARLPGRSLPIVLAGDELQTVHATAFRWANVTSGFYELTGAAFGAGEARIIDEALLRSNFRSVSEVVDLANAVQSVRRTQLGEDHATSQESLRGPSSVPGVFFSTGDLSKDDFAAILSTNVVLVPCAEGREREYVLADPHLREVFSRIAPDWMEGDPEHASPVYGPHEAKGLEFSLVVLYGWGRHVPAPSVAKSAKGGLDGRARYTNLYVAATRASSRVVAIESPEDLTLWSELAAAIDSAHGGPSLREGASADIDAVVGDARALADEMAERGRRLESASELLRAADRFSALQLDHDSKRCRAEALSIDGRQGDAAALFDEIGEHGLAEDCLWHGQDFDALMVRDPATPVGRSRQVVAQAMTAAEGSVALWTSCADGLRDLRELGTAIGRDGAWTSALAAYLDAVDRGLHAGEDWGDEALERVVALAEHAGTASESAALPHVVVATWLAAPTVDAPVEALRAAHDRYRSGPGRQRFFRWCIGEALELDVDLAIGMLEFLAQLSTADSDAVELELLVRSDPESAHVAEVVARRVKRLSDALRDIETMVVGGKP